MAVVLPGWILSCLVAMTSSGIVPAPAGPYWLSSVTVTDTPGETRIAMFYLSVGWYDVAVTYLSNPVKNQHDLTSHASTT
jgi:hypothetical protein